MIALGLFSLSLAFLFAHAANQIGQDLRKQDAKRERGLLYIHREPTA